MPQAELADFDWSPSSAGGATTLMTTTVAPSTMLPPMPLFYDPASIYAAYSGGYSGSGAASLYANYLSSGEFANSSTPSIYASTMSSSLVPVSNHVFGDVLFAYTSPFLIFLGLVGNMLSLIVFMLGPRSSKVARSQYLLCLGISDSIVLLSYVLPEWVKRGVTTLDPSAKYLSNAIYDSWRCYTILFFSYSSRFVSAWLRVLFTFERFYSIRFPFKRLTFATRVTRIFISLTVVSGLLISSLKPPLMQSRLNLELSAASSAGTSPSYYTESYDIDIKTLLTTSPSYDPITKQSLINLSLNLAATTGVYDDAERQPQNKTLAISGSGSSLLPSTRLTEQYDDGRTTTQVDPRMLEALLHVFGSSKPGKGSMNSSDFMDAMLGEATPNPVCVVRPEYRRYGEIYDTLYFGIFIMLLPFLLIIVFDFNVLYVVRHREGYLFGPTASVSSGHQPPSRKATLGSHQEFIAMGSLHGRQRIMSVGSSSLVPDKLTVMLVLSSCFILLNLPYFIVWSIYSYFIQPSQTTHAKAKFAEISTDIFNNLSFAARTISGLTYSVNGLIYLVSDHAFRADFLSIVKRCWFWRRSRLTKSSSSVRQTGGHTTNPNGGLRSNHRQPNSPTSNLPHRDNSDPDLVHSPQSPSAMSRKSSHKSVADDGTKANASLAKVTKNGSLPKPASDENEAALVVPLLPTWTSPKPFIIDQLPAADHAHRQAALLTRQRSVHFADEGASRRLRLLTKHESTLEHQRPASPAVKNAQLRRNFSESARQAVVDDAERSSGVSSGSSQLSVTGVNSSSFTNHTRDTSNSDAHHQHQTNNKKVPLTLPLPQRKKSARPMMVKSGSEITAPPDNAQPRQLKTTSSMLVIYCELESCI